MRAQSKGIIAALCAGLVVSTVVLAEPVDEELVIDGELWLALIGSDGVLPVFESEEPAKQEQEAAPAIAAADVPVPEP